MKMMQRKLVNATLSKMINGNVYLNLRKPRLILDCAFLIMEVHYTASVELQKIRVRLM
jgi:hypothetical protein